MKRLFSAHLAWGRRTDTLPWGDPPTVAALLTGTADAEQWREAEVFVAELRYAAVRRGLATASMAPALGLTAVMLLDVVLRVLRGIL